MSSNKPPPLPSPIRTLTVDSKGHYYCERCTQHVAYVATVRHDGSAGDVFLWGCCKCPKWSATDNPGLARQIEELAMDRSGNFRVYAAGAFTH